MWAAQHSLQPPACRHVTCTHRPLPARREARQRTKAGPYKCCNELGLEQHQVAVLARHLSTVMSIDQQLKDSQVSSKSEQTLQEHTSNRIHAVLAGSHALHPSSDHTVQRNTATNITKAIAQIRDHALRELVVAGGSDVVGTLDTVSRVCGHRC